MIDRNINYEDRIEVPNVIVSRFSKTESVLHTFSSAWYYRALVSFICLRASRAITGKVLCTTSIYLFRSDIHPD